MPRGRQYYDPIEQAPGKVEGEPDLSRIELFMSGGSDQRTVGEDTAGKWIARRISPDGSVYMTSNGSFDHDQALAEAQALWPDLTVYELQDEREDSTWEGTGPSPRLWQTISQMGLPPAVDDLPREAFWEGVAETTAPPTEEQVPLHVMAAAQTGTYVLLDDIRNLLETWAVAYEIDKNPSAAMALRDAVDALKDIG